ncbi:MAG: lysophospholipase [Actinomycetota bacterium]
MAGSARIDYGTSRTGTRLLRRQWVPEGVPRAIIVIVHGIAEHSGRYDAVGRQMADADFGVVSYDQEGHGESGDRRGHVNDFGTFIDDLEDLLAEARTIGVPIVLCGHSMGGLIAATYAVSDRPQPDLLVLSGPALGALAPAAQQTFAHKLAQLAPKAHPKLPFDPMVLSRDPGVAEAYTNDPLIKGGGSAALISGLFRAADATGATLDRIRVPTLCLHGRDDELVVPEASAGLEGLPGVERRVLDGLRHEIFNEPEGPEVVQQVIDWIDSQLA